METNDLKAHQSKSTHLQYLQMHQLNQAELRQANKAITKPYKKTQSVDNFMVEPQLQSTSAQQYISSTSLYSTTEQTSASPIVFHGSDDGTYKIIVQCQRNVSVFFLYLF